VHPLAGVIHGWGRPQPFSCTSHEGGGSTDLRLFISTKLTIVNYWLYSLMYNKQNYYLNNI
jgi:hypothetical protein